MQWTAISTFRSAYARAQKSTRDQRGASVLEWAMIAAVVVVASALIGGVIFQIVKDKGDELKDCAGQPTGNANCSGP